MKLGRRLVGVVVAIVIFTIDRVLKILTNLGQLHGSLGPIQFIPLHNPGAMGGTFRHQHLLLGLLGLVVMIGLAVIWWRHRAARYELLFQVGWGLVFGAAVGNTLDRLVYGYVTDMFHIPPQHGIFNLADISLQLGLVLMLMYAVMQSLQSRAR